MRPYLLGFAVLGLWASSEVTASAAWNNVFQPTLFGRLRRNVTNNYYAAPAPVAAPVASFSSPVVAYSAPPAAACPTPCPQQQCTTQYVQRSYYQPVTTYQTQTQYEKVTSYRTSYYYEPVTSYRYSCYYDPCSCSYQQVATPTTSYQLRSQNCPVENWVARCYQVPVTTQKLVTYWQPQTTCCSTTYGDPVYNQPPAQQTAFQQPAYPQASCNTPPAPQTFAGTPPPPMIDNQRSPGAPSITDQRPNGGVSNPNPMYQRFYPPITPNNNPSAEVPPMPPASWQQPSQRQPLIPSPPVRLEGIAAGAGSSVEGQVVRNDRSPRASAKILFVNAQNGQRQTANANTAGRFQVDLSGGSWLVYVYGADDLPTYSERIEVYGRTSAPLMLVSR